VIVENASRSAGDAERTVTVLQGGGRDHDGQQPSAGVDRDVPLAAVDLFPPSYPLLAVGTVSAARTVWESIAAAVGTGPRPSARRARSRSAA
jgi:hypothetical protein